MSTCKDCLHVEVCEKINRYHADVDEFTGRVFTDMDKSCEYFKDRSKFIELPCKVGDTVYVIDDMGDEEYLVASCTISAIRYECKETDSKIIIMTEGFLAPFTNSWVLGKTVFLTREEAEKALKERENI